MNSGRTPEDYRAFFAEVFAELDAHPRAIKLKVRGEGLTVDFKDGNPVFVTADGESVRADYRRRWLPEHPVPLVFSAHGETIMRFTPTTGNRVKVGIKGFDGHQRRALDILYKFASRFYKTSFVKNAIISPN